MNLFTINNWAQSSSNLDVLVFSETKLDILCNTSECYHLHIITN